MEELTGRWQSLSLTDKEDQRIVMQTEDSDGGKKFRRYHAESTQNTHHTEYKDSGGRRGSRGKPPTETVKEPTPSDKEISISPRSRSKISPMPKSDLPSFTQQLKEIDLALESHAVTSKSQLGVVSLIWKFCMRTLVSVGYHELKSKIK
ncbi:hypothetical protein FCV25MIE_21933 [Fagus crenata]